MYLLCRIRMSYCWVCVMRYALFMRYRIIDDDALGHCMRYVSYALCVALCTDV